MMIKSVKMNNIRSYTEEKVEFPPGSTLLSGDIGCGKSTILQSIEFALFGTGKNLSGSDLLRHGSNSGRINLEVEMDGKNVGIERTLRRGKSISQDTCTLTIDGHVQELMPLEIKSKVLELLGYSQEMLKKNKPLFRFTVYTPQEDMKKILTDDDDRLEIVRDIFNVDKYGLIRENSKIFLTELRRMKTGHEGELRTIETDISGLENIKKIKNDIESKAASEKSNLSGLSAYAEERKHSLDALRVEFSKLNLAKHEFVRTESDLAAKRKRIAHAGQEKDEIEERISDYMQLTAKKHAKNVQDLKKCMAENEKKRDSLLAGRAVLNEDARKLQKIHSEGLCGLCGQKVHNPQEFAQHIEEIKSKINAINSEVSSIDNTCSEIKNSISEAESTEQYERLISDSEERKQRLTHEISMTEKDISELNGKIQGLVPKIEGYDQIQEKIGSAEDSFYSAQKKRSDSERTLAIYEQQIKDFNRRIAEINSKMELSEELRQKISRIAGLVAWFDPFMVLMEAMEKHVMLSVQREFNEHFQKWFSMLMGEQLAVKIDESFGPVIEQNGYLTEYGNLSGGEKTSVALAYRLALNKVVNDMTESIKTKGIMILDEPTDGFSSDQLDRIRDVIGELNLRQIIIVSHEAKIDSYVQNVIRIFKENHVSRVAS